MKLLILFLSLAGMAWGKPVALYKFDGNGLCTGCQNGVTAMTSNGTPTFVTTPGCTTYTAQMSGPFTDSHYWTNTTLYAALSTTADSYEIDFEMDLTSGSGYPYIFNTCDGGANCGGFRFFWYTDDQKFYWACGGSGHETSDTFGAGTGCHFVQLKWDGTHATCTIDGTQEIYTTDSYTMAGADVVIGYHGIGGGAFSGVIQNLYVDDLTPFGTPTPTFTYTPTPVATPTQGCLAKFTPYPGNPIMTPVPTAEEDTNAEPSVLVDGSPASLLMGYLSGWTDSSISLATSTDAIHWTKVGTHPIIGQGYGGEPAGASRDYLIKVGGIYREYYTQSGTGDLRVCFSGDGSTYTRQTQVVSSATSGGGISMANTAMYQVGYGSTWWGIFDSEHSSGPQWVDDLYKSTDNALTFQFQRHLTSLTMTAGIYANGICSAPWLDYYNGIYHCWLLEGPQAVLPDEIFHAASFDLMNWNVDACTVISLTGNSMGIVPEQEADPCLIEWKGKSYLYYDATDNAHSRARIGVAIYNGTLAQLFSGLAASSSLYLSKQLKLKP